MPNQTQLENKDEAISLAKLAASSNPQSLKHPIGMTNIPSSLR